MLASYLTLAFAACALALPGGWPSGTSGGPGGSGTGSSPPCAGSFPLLQCCAVNAVGLLDLNCANPPSTPTSPADFESICAAEGQQAQCCLLPVAGQALICESPIGA